MTTIILVIDPGGWLQVLSLLLLLRLLRNRILPPLLFVLPQLQETMAQRRQEVCTALLQLSTGVRDEEPQGVQHVWVKQIIVNFDARGHRLAKGWTETINYAMKIKKPVALHGKR